MKQCKTYMYLRYSIAVLERTDTGQIRRIGWLKSKYTNQVMITDDYSLIKDVYDRIAYNSTRYELKIVMRYISVQEKVQKIRTFPLYN